MYHHVDFAPRSPFPDLSLSLMEMIFFRSWQAAGIVRICYYYALFLGFFSFVYNIVIWTVNAGVGGFFAGLIIGLLSMFFMWMMARIMSELALSVYQIRDYTAAGVNGGHSNASGMQSAQSNSNNNNNATSISYQNAKPPGGEAYSELKIIKKKK